MKKINSINYGGKVLLAGIVELVVIPFLLYVLLWITEIRVFRYLCIACMIIGGITIIGFFTHLCIELHQDRVIDRYYSGHKNVLLYIRENVYECGNCGNRKVTADSRSCSVCGCFFRKEECMNPQQILNQRCNKIHKVIKTIKNKCKIYRIKSGKYC